MSGQTCILVSKLCCKDKEKKDSCKVDQTIELA